MSSFRLIFASLLYHWRLHLSVGLAVATATAVLTGALIVGDSMRASLRDIVLDRLGRIDEVLVTDRFFREALADELAVSPGFAEAYSGAVPVIFMRATVEHSGGLDPAEGNARRASGVNVIGCRESFWELDTRGIRPDPPPNAHQIVLNERLAQRLGAGVGDEVLVRLPAIEQVPADSPLGEKRDTVASRRLTVVGVVPAEGLGRFALAIDQRTPQNAFVPIETLQQMLGKSGQVNAILVAGRPGTDAAPAEASERLASSLEPTLADYGLSIGHVQSTFQGEVVFDYFQLTSDRLILPEAVERTVLREMSTLDPQPALTYLANEIRTDKLPTDGVPTDEPQTDGGQSDKTQATIPYSTLTAIDANAQLGPFATGDDGRLIGPLDDDEIVLNGWAAEDLRRQGASLQTGNPITLTFFEPESTHGQIRERSETLRLKAVVALARPNERPLRTNDPHLTPEVQGVTDQESIENWDPPFPFDNARVRSVPPNDQDEQYWNDYRATPKAFVSLATGRRLFASRFGQSTSLRIPAGDGRRVEDLRSQLRDALDPAELGFLFRPVKRLGLEAATGTTPFQWLFLGFSMFIIASAVMLVALMFQLGTLRRAEQVGIMVSVGLGRGQVLRLLAVEGACVAVLGGALGLAGAIGFAWAMIAALTSPNWWLDAISVPFLRLDVGVTSLVVGGICGTLVSVVVIAWTLRGMRHAAPRQLLAGQLASPTPALGRTQRRGRWVVAGLLLSAAALGLLATQLGGEGQAGAFLASGAAVLAGLLFFLWIELRAGRTRQMFTARRGALARLALRNGARHPGRNVLTIGLVAAASFLIIAISAFRLAPTEEGTGGFDLYAESDTPLFFNPATPEGMEQFGFSDRESALLNESQTITIRVHGDQDASCLNLYQTQQPRVLGMPASFIERGRFQWASSLAETPEEKANPWRLLEKPSASGEDGYPVVMDANTATYGLKVGLGGQLQIDDERGRPVTLRVVGLLKNSILQGDLMTSEAVLTRLFPEVSGYRIFLVDTPRGQSSEVAEMLEDRLSDQGFHAVATVDRLLEFLSVQNTYLSTFQSLGGLGLLLGTFGVAAVQLRNVLERRSELALMRAVGFRRRRLGGLVMLESVLLLLGGLVTGVLAAAVAVLPHFLLGGASIPVKTLGAMLALILAVGLLAATAALRAVLKAPLLEALRGQ